MSTSSTMLALPRVKGSAFVNGDMNIVIYSSSTKAMNPDKIVNKKDVFEGFKNKITKLFEGDAQKLAYFLDQMKSPGAWLCWNTLQTPPRGYFGVDDRFLFHPIRPRSASEKSIGRIKMANGRNRVVLAPYYGFSSLQSVKYQDVWTNTVVIQDFTGAQFTAKDFPQDPNRMRMLIDQVYMGIIYNEFHFEKPEEQYRAYVLGFRGSQYKPRHGVNTMKPVGMQEPVLYPVIEEEETHDAGPPTAEQDPKANAKRELETDDEAHNNSKSQKIATEAEKPQVTTEEPIAGNEDDTPTLESLQKRIFELEEQLQAAHEGQQQSTANEIRKHAANLASIDDLEKVLTTKVRSREVAYRADTILRLMRLCNFAVHDDAAQIIKDFLLVHGGDVREE